jgi:hypothetical protein
MKEYYTYAYLREDGTPYYIGKGQDKRITNRHYRRDGGYFSAPKDKDRIIYLKRNLTEKDAFRHEQYMISVYGRKDIGTGILRNRTNGGEGPTGKVLSEVTRKRISESQKGKPKWSDDDKERIRRQVTGRWETYGDEKKETIRQKLRDRENKGGATGDRNAKSKSWTIYHECGRITELTGISNWAKTNGYNQSHIISVRNGERKRHKDIIKVEMFEKYCQ